MATLFIHHDDQVTALQVPQGTPLTTALRGQGFLVQPCGMGRCGKCLVHAQTVPTAEEQRLIGQQGIDAGFRLACHILVEDALHISIPMESAAAVLTSYAASSYEWTPVIRKVDVTLPAPELHDQRDDLRVVMDAAGATEHALTLPQLAALPDCRRHAPQSSVLLHGHTLVGVTKRGPHTGLIIDIGTTTVAALLVDMHTGETLGVRGERNAQASFGADVLTRIRHSMEHGIQELRTAIVDQINRLLAALRKTQDVSLMVVTGNTTMLHLFCGLPVEHIGKAPFVPAMLDAFHGNARLFGIASDATLFLMPGISAYIGADITASLLAAEAQRAQRPFLLLDLGTNAEIVLFAEGTFHTCSAAAGPCFEGATLECGMAGQDGAIEHVKIQAGELCFSVIGNQPPQGLCGSAVLDCVALLLDTGALDASGKLEAAGDLAACIRPYGKQLALHVSEAIVLTQKDIREVQLAKAAVRAGVEVLLQQAGCSIDDMETVYLAGGFGSALSLRSAIRMGLVPPVAQKSVRMLGNAASYGALRYASEAEAREHAQHIIRRTQHVELSAHPAFSSAYIEHITFPEPQHVL